MGVLALRRLLHDAAIRFAVLRNEESATVLDALAEQYGEEKRRSRVRRDKWKERKEARTVGDGFKFCRVQGCTRDGEWRPVLSFPPLDGESDRIRVETAMLDVCEPHAHSLGPDTYTENPDVWRAITKVWTEAGMEPPDPELAEVEYVRTDVPGGEKRNGT